MYKTNHIKIKDFNDFNSAGKHFGIELNNNQLLLFKKYHEILLDWNKKINLISRKEENILEKHFLDSILFLPEIENLINKDIEVKVLDIGSGGGFPAIPLAIMKPEWNFTLCESIKKKANFLKSLVQELNIIKNTSVVNARVEMLSGVSLQLDLVTARAVGKLDELIKLSFPLLKKGCYLLAYKAESIEEEAANAEKKYKADIQIKIHTKKINDVIRKLITIKKLK